MNFVPNTINVVNNNESDLSYLVKKVDDLDESFKCLLNYGCDLENIKNETICCVNDIVNNGAESINNTIDDSKSILTSTVNNALCNVSNLCSKSLNIMETSADYNINLLNDKCTQSICAINTECECALNTIECCHIETEYALKEQCIKSIADVELRAKDIIGCGDAIHKLICDFDECICSGTFNMKVDTLTANTIIATCECITCSLGSSEDCLELRNGATTGLDDTTCAGFIIRNYDGITDGVIEIDNTGTLKIGDLGDAQPVLTRSAATDMKENAPLLWCADCKCAYTGPSLQSSLENQQGTNICAKSLCGMDGINSNIITATCCVVTPYIQNSSICSGYISTNLVSSTCGLNAGGYHLGCGIPEGCCIDVVYVNCYNGQQYCRAGLQLDCYGQWYVNYRPIVSRNYNSVVTEGCPLVWDSQGCVTSGEFPALFNYECLCTNDFNVCANIIYANCFYGTACNASRINGLTICIV